MKRKSLLTVIIVTWNSSDCISNCLASLAKELKSTGSEVIVIDNNSADDTVLKIKSSFPGVIIIENRENRGFGAANNQGLELANGEYVLFLNPDTVLPPKSVGLMLAFLKNYPSAGIVGPEQKDENGKITFNFSRYTLRGLLEYGIEKLMPNSNLCLALRKPYKVRFLNGGCWMTRRKSLISVGGYDGRLFLYGEEPDVCLRIKKAGWDIYFLRNVWITHLREKSMRKIGWRKYLYAARSFSKVIVKHAIGHSLPNKLGIKLITI